MESTYLDDAFNWLVVLLGTIAATMCQFPELMRLYRKGEAAEPTLIVRVMVFPLLVLVLLWLAGSLSRKAGPQATWKSLSWMYASLILAADIVLLLMGSVPSIQDLFEQGAGILQATVLLELVIAAPFYAFVIRPRMRRVYEDAGPANNPVTQTFLAVVAVALYLLAVGFVELTLGASPF